MLVTLTLVLAKSLAALSRAAGRGGGQALPGLVADKLDPNLAAKLARRLPHGVILVTGTNGKTTTTRLLVECLSASGEKVLTNSTGSNLKRGITSAMIQAASLSGRMSQTVGVFEVDEANVRLVAPLLQPKAIVVLNLFRDQLDRYGELDTTAAIIGEGIAATRARLYLNADDPLVASLARYAKEPGDVAYFGLDEVPERQQSQASMAIDSDRCPLCHQKLSFKRISYAHLGDYRCPNGDFFRPDTGVTATKITQADVKGTKFMLEAFGRTAAVSFPLPGIYNLYNALAATAAANGAQVPLAVLVKSLSQATAAFGRVEMVQYRGRQMVLLLIKNPAGFTQVMETFLRQEPGMNVIMAINDLDADGRDVSWLWDVPFEEFSDLKHRVITSGIRASDMTLRLHYAGMPADTVTELESALDGLAEATPAGETGYVLATYTAMLSIRRLLSRLTGLKEEWK